MCGLGELGEGALLSEAQKNSLLGWEDDLVGKALAAQCGDQSFNPQSPCEAHSREQLQSLCSALPQTQNTVTDA